MTKAFAFANKVALVTGAGAGIGAGIAMMLAARGASVALLGRRREPLENIAARICESGGDALVVQGDTSKPQDMENAVARTVETFGALHCAVNNAAITEPIPKPIHEITIEDWNAVIGVNLSGVFYGMKYQIRAMLEAGGGSIVNISSILGDRAFPGRAGYVSAKHGMYGLTRTAALDVAKLGIRVNEIMPGLIATEMVANAPDEVAKLALMTPLGRLGEVNELAAAACFLLSDEATYINGARLAVDAGFLA